MKWKILISSLAATTPMIPLMTMSGCNDEQNDEKIKVTDIIISGTNAVEVGEKEPLQSKVLPREADDKSVIWSSNNSNVVSIDPESGVITGEGIGSAIITASAQDGSGVTTSFTVDVANATPLHFEKDLASSEDSTITYRIAVTYPTWEIPNPNVEYSYDNITWFNWEKETVEGEEVPVTKTITDGQPLYVRNSKSSLSNFYNYFNFQMTGLISAKGNINSLVNYSNPGLYSFNRTFYECSSLTTAPYLPSTAINDGCYLEMFMGCTALKTPIYLPATQLLGNCYYSMFENCTSLTAIYKIPVEDFGGSYAYSDLNSMYRGCTNIKIAEDVGYDEQLVLDLSSFDSFGPYDTDNMFANTAGSFTGTPQPHHKYYLEI